MCGSLISTTAIRRSCGSTTGAPCRAASSIFLPHGGGAGLFQQGHGQCARAICRPCPPKATIPVPDGGINQLTPYELNSTTRVAYNAAPRFRRARRGPKRAPTVPQNIPFRSSYGAAGRPTSTLLEISERLCASRSAPSMQLRGIAEAFAVLGAVDQVSVTHGGQTATQLTITHLREGVTAADAIDLAGSLGLSATILY